MEEVSEQRRDIKKPETTPLDLSSKQAQTSI